jgi:hypothetical protein
MQTFKLQKPILKSVQSRDEAQGKSDEFTANNSLNIHEISISKALIPAITEKYFSIHITKCRSKLKELKSAENKFGIR